jgi:hypothetical protein
VAFGWAGRFGECLHETLTSYLPPESCDLALICAHPASPASQVTSFREGSATWHSGSLGALVQMQVLPALLVGQGASHPRACQCYQLLQIRRALALISPPLVRLDDHILPGAKAVSHPRLDEPMAPSVETGHQRCLLYQDSLRLPVEFDPF